MEKSYQLIKHRGQLIVNIPSIGEISKNSGMKLLHKYHDGVFKVGKDSVASITVTGDGKVEFIAFKNHTLAYVKSAMNYPAYYPVHLVKMEKPAVLTSLKKYS